MRAKKTATMYLDDVKPEPTSGVIWDVTEGIALMQRLTLLRRAFVTAAVLLPVTTALRVKAAASPTATVQQLIDGLLQTMKAGPATPFRQRFAMLAPVIDKTFDLPTILQESVGSAWSTLQPDQQSMLNEAFRGYTIASYVNNFDDFNGQRFDINPDMRSVGSEKIVETKIIPKNGDTHELDYVMRDGPQGWRVVDVLADGSISRVAVQRSDFRRLINRGGPQALADSLRAKSADLSDGSS
jgi:phospholipid transport system substrate-binding protein